MMIAFVFCGTAAGLLTGAYAFFIGFSFWFAILTYSAVGVATVLLAILFTLLFGGHRKSSDPGIMQLGVSRADQL